MSRHSLCLLPEPITCEEGEGAFSLAQGLNIVLSHSAEPGEWIAARAVQAALRAWGIAAPIQPQRRCRDTGETIILAVRGRDEAIFPTAPPPGPANHTYVDGGTDNHEGYSLEVSRERIAVWGASPIGLAHGARTLCQILAQVEGAAPALRIDDAPAFRWRGAMLDVSRGKVPTLETLKGLVDVIASFKMNMLQLYVEHTFAFRSHPDIGKEWGALTAEEVAALDAYCRDRYVELVPCLQSFGHLRRMLELPAYAHLAESAERWSLAPIREESYALLDDLYADHLACFSSSYINVCSDETYDLGAGQSAELAAREEAADQLVTLRREAHDLRREYTRVWLARNKPEGLWLTLDQFNVGAAVLDRWAVDALPRYGWGQ